MVKLDKPVLIIDGYNLFIRYFFNPFTQHSYNNNGVLYLFINNIINKCKHLNIPIQNVLVVFDRGASTHKSISSTYKNNRATFYRSIQKTSFNSKLRRLKEYLTVLNTTMLEIPGVEADLIIGYLVQYILNTVPNIYIDSNDNDFWQLLVFKNVCLFYKNKEIININNYDRFIKYFKYCPPASYPLYKALKGDKTDNITGLKGVGDKTLEKLFYNVWLHKRFLYSVDDLLKFLDSPDIPPSVIKLKKAISTNTDTIKTNFTLVNLLQMDLLSLNAKIRIDQEMMLAIKKLDSDLTFNSAIFKKMCEEDGLIKFLENGDKIISLCI